MLRSAQISGFDGIECHKNEKGVPVPTKGVHWSRTHKPGFVAGVVSVKTVGIDIERLKSVNEGLFKKIVHPEEKQKFNKLSETENDNQLFFRVFTAKEAVLKKYGIGLKGLSKVRIIDVIDSMQIVVDFENEKTRVEHFYLDDHIASVTKDLFDVQWTIWEQ